LRKTYFFIFLLLLSIGNVFGQGKIELVNSSWEGTHSPIKKGNQLFFQGDTLIIVDLEAIKPADQYQYRLKSDTLFLSLIDDLSYSCREERPARYRVFWANNGEKMYFKPIEDACMDRFTLLVSESPWYKIREESDLRADWHFLEPNKDPFPGIGLYEAYKLLKHKKSTPVKVAVIDCPVDYKHEDLMDNIWSNPKETPDNKIDDDNNGFKDDLRGWFFSCSKAGIPTEFEQHESTQIVRMWKSRYDSISSPSALSESEKKNFGLYQRAKTTYLAGFSAAQTCSLALSDSVRFIQILGKMKSMVQEPVDKNQILGWDLGNDDFSMASKTVVAEFFQDEGPGSFQDFASSAKRWYSIIKQAKQPDWLYYYNLDYDPRKEIGDHPEIPFEKMYGCGSLKNPSRNTSNHGTMVAGIIAGKRGNGKGIEGIADNVQIICLSAVPAKGDERDKDVANCIRYAVDQGAKIINMSFVKRFSPHKSTVDEAIRYAEKKGVLLVRAAGNQGLNADTAEFFPNPIYESGEKAKNWIVAGNSTYSLNSGLVAPSSNYGGKSVDLFAPGTEIFTTAPANGYGLNSGTSFSAPVVSGVAALLWSYFPKLTVTEVKKILLESSFKPEITVRKPGTFESVPFKSLSQSGGIVNAKAAVLLAEKMSKKKKA
jgi:cell wall-associated protease